MRASQNSSLTPPPSPFQTEVAPTVDVVDGWVLLRRIGAGGMSVVYEVRHALTGRRGALKWLHACLAEDDLISQRFSKEIDALTSFDHPNIVSVLDRGWNSEREYVVLDLVDGGTLRDDLEKNGPMLQAEAIRVTVEVLKALEVVHNAGIIHRDVKPSNILLDSNGTPKLADFGIAHDNHAKHRLTSTGHSVGTTSFMAPEQAIDASKVGPSADIYAVGTTLYTLLTGGRPLALFQDGVDSPRLRRLTPEVRGIVYRATRFDAGRRFQSAAAMGAALTSLSENAAPRPTLLWGGAALAALGGMLGSSTIIVAAFVTLIVFVPGIQSQLSGRTRPRVDTATYTPVLESTPDADAAENRPVRHLRAPTPDPIPAAPQKTRTVTPPKPVGPPGRVYMNSIPPAQLLIGATSKGKTGWSGEVPAGTHRFELRLANGESHEFELSIQSGKTLRYCWDFRSSQVCRRR